LEKLGAVLGSERLNFAQELSLLFFVEWGSGGCASGDGDSYFHKKLFLAGGGTDAEHAHGRMGTVPELMGRVGGDVNGFACLDEGFLSTEGCFDCAFEQDEGFFEVVAVRRRSATRRNVHVNDREPARGLLAGDGDGVGVADQSNVGEGGVLIGPRQGEGAAEVIGRKRRVRLEWSCHDAL
jgi:hypothetical protein